MRRAVAGWSCNNNFRMGDNRFSLAFSKDLLVWKKLVKFSNRPIFFLCLWFYHPFYSMNVWLFWCQIQQLFSLYLTLGLWLDCNLLTRVMVHWAEFEYQQCFNCLLKLFYYTGWNSGFLLPCFFMTLIWLNLWQ